MLAAAICGHPTATPATFRKENAMNRLSTALLALSLVAMSGAATAAPQSRDDHRDRRDDHRPPAHHDKGHDHRPHRYARGERLGDGHRGSRVDYHRYHLSAPPRGHEWRRVDNDYVLVAVATGIITSVVAAGR
jgi:Ni/Co efflux regulator RcnB